MTSSNLEPGHIYTKPHDGPFKGKSGGALALRGASGRIDFYLDIFVTYEIVDMPGDDAPYTCQTTGYSYILSDLEDREIMVFQWAPQVSPPFQYPHMHMSIAGNFTSKDGQGMRREYRLGNFHIPTGQVRIEDVVELLIREFEIEAKRREWEKILAENRSIS